MTPGRLRALVLAVPFLLWLPTEGVRAEDRIVQRVVDGDTIILNGGERVRLIGVDTPESVHPRRPVEYFALEASAFTKQAAEGKQVWLEYDQTRTDRYGRTLAYVHLSTVISSNTQ